MKKILLLILASIVVFGLFGCGETLPEDEMLITRAEELIPQTEEFNRLFYIEGIPLKEGGKEENGYAPADEAGLAMYGITKISEATNLMEGIWSKDYIEDFQKSTLISSVIDGNYIASYAYCYDKYDKSKNFIGVMVDVDGLPIQAGRVEYLYDTLYVKEKTEDTAILKLEVIVKDENGNQKQTSLTVTLTKDNAGVWYLNSNTAVVYPKDSYPLPK